MEGGKIGVTWEVGGRMGIFCRCGPTGYRRTGVGIAVSGHTLFSYERLGVGDGVRGYAGTWRIRGDEDLIGLVDHFCFHSSPHEITIT